MPNERSHHLEHTATQAGLTQDSGRSNAAVVGGRAARGGAAWARADGRPHCNTSRGSGLDLLPYNTHAAGTMADTSANLHTKGATPAPRAVLMPMAFCRCLPLAKDTALPPRQSNSSIHIYWSRSHQLSCGVCAPQAEQGQGCSHGLDSWALCCVGGTSFLHYQRREFLFRVGIPPSPTPPERGAVPRHLGIGQGGSRLDAYELRPTNVCMPHALPKSPILPN